MYWPGCRWVKWDIYNCHFSSFQDQFEFALTAVAEEVNAILKALPQWNQCYLDQYPVRQTAPWPSHSHFYLTLPFLSMVVVMMMMMIIKMKKDVVPLYRDSLKHKGDVRKCKNNLLSGDFKVRKDLHRHRYNSDLIFKYLRHRYDVFRDFQRVKSVHPQLIWIEITPGRSKK